MWRPWMLREYGVRPWEFSRFTPREMDDVVRDMRDDLAARREE